MSEVAPIEVDWEKILNNNGKNESQVRERAEMHVLYTLIFEHDSYDGKLKQQNYIFSILSPEHFESSVYRKCYESITHISINNNQINLFEIDKELRKTYIPMTTIDLMNHINSAFTTTVGFESSVDYLVDSFKKKELYKYADNITQIFKSGGSLNEMNNAVLNIPNLNNRNKDLTTEELMQLAYDDIEVRLKNGDQLLGNETYIPPLDTLIGGIKDKELIMLTAEPNIGKSLLAQQIAINTAMHKKKVAYFNFEMNEKSLGYRNIAMLIKMDIAKLNKPDNLSAKDFAQLDEFNTTAVNENLFIYTNVKRNISDIVTKCKLFAGTLDLIVIDYLQLVEGYGADKIEKVEMVCQALKSLACDQNCPVIAISSLNRQGDLRGSHQLDFDADQIWFMKRDHKSTEAGLRATAGIEITKNRDGGKGTIVLFFNEKHLTFEKIIEV